jgi:nitric oxide dioxygenase
MAGMLPHLAGARSHLPIMLLHADHDEDAFALRGQIRDDITALPNASKYIWYEQGANSQLPVRGVFPGRMDISQVHLPNNASYHPCRPVPFMQAVRSGLIERGVAPRDIQYEVFGPDLWQADYE